MNYRVKGYAANPAGIAIALGVTLVVGAAVGAGVTYWWMSTHQGGLGEGDSLEILQETAVSDAVPESMTEIPTESETEPPSTEPVTENLNYIKVKVSGSDYIYKNEVYTLEEITGIIRGNPGLPVRIEEDGASLRAYDGLLKALDEMGAEYAEAHS